MNQSINLYDPRVNHYVDVALRVDHYIRVNYEKSIHWRGLRVNRYVGVPQ